MKPHGHSPLENPADGRGLLVLLSLLALLICLVSGCSAMFGGRHPEMERLTETNVMIMPPIPTGKALADFAPAPVPQKPVIVTWRADYIPPTEIVWEETTDLKNYHVIGTQPIIIGITNYSCIVTANMVQGYFRIGVR